MGDLPPMDSIEPDDLYAEQGNVSWACPITQGDVFEGVAVPGFGRVTTVQIVMHPCAMRDLGGRLLERVTIAPVDDFEEIKGSMWNGQYRVMPLANLGGPGQHSAAMLVETTAVSASELTLDRRIAVLSQPGVLVLQQRLIMHSTRFAEVDLDTLRSVSSSIFTECELQTDWVEAAIERLGSSQETVDQAGTAFVEWLGGGKGSRRDLLKSDANHAGLRRDLRAETKQRYGA